MYTKQECYKQLYKYKREGRQGVEEKLLELMLSEEVPESVVKFIESQEKESIASILRNLTQKPFFKRLYKDFSETECVKALLSMIINLEIDAEETGKDRKIVKSIFDLDTLLKSISLYFEGDKGLFLDQLEKYRSIVREIMKKDGGEGGSTSDREA